METPDQVILKEEDRSKLDGIVSKMHANKEPDSNIQFVVNDFKDKYGVKKKSEPYKYSFDEIQSGAVEAKPVSTYSGSTPTFVSTAPEIKKTEQLRQKTLVGKIVTDAHNIKSTVKDYMDTNLASKQAGEFLDSDELKVFNSKTPEERQAGMMGLTKSKVERKNSVEKLLTDGYKLEAIPTGAAQMDAGIPSMKKVPLSQEEKGKLKQELNDLDGYLQNTKFFKDQKLEREALEKFPPSEEPVTEEDLKKRGFMEFPQQHKMVDFLNDNKNDIAQHYPELLPLLPKDPTPQDIFKAYFNVLHADYQMKGEGITDDVVLDNLKKAVHTVTGTLFMGQDEQNHIALGRKLKALAPIALLNTYHDTEEDKNMGVDFLKNVAREFYPDYKGTTKTENARSIVDALGHLDIPKDQLNKSATNMVTKVSETSIAEDIVNGVGSVLGSLPRMLLMSAVTEGAAGITGINNLIEASAKSTNLATRAGSFLMRAGKTSAVFGLTGGENPIKDAIGFQAGVEGFEAAFGKYGKVVAPILKKIYGNEAGGEMKSILEKTGKFIGAGAGITAGTEMSNYTSALWNTMMNDADWKTELGKRGYLDKDGQWTISNAGKQILKEYTTNAMFGFLGLSAHDIDNKKQAFSSLATELEDKGIDDELVTTLKDLASEKKSPEEGEPMPHPLEDVIRANKQILDFWMKGQRPTYKPDQIKQAVTPGLPEPKDNIFLRLPQPTVGQPIEPAQPISAWDRNTGENKNIFPDKDGVYEVKKSFGYPEDMRFQMLPDGSMKMEGKGYEEVPIPGQGVMLKYKGKEAEDTETTPATKPTEKPVAKEKPKKGVATTPEGTTEPIVKKEKAKKGKGTVETDEGVIPIEKNINLEKNKPDGTTTVLSNRLSPAEKQGAISAGRGNVEASNVAEGIYRASSKGEGVNQGLPQEEIREKQSEALKKHSQDNGTWVENPWETFGAKPDAQGAEQIVYINKEGGTVTKINSGSVHGDWREFFERIAIHNSLFPDTKYTLKGFTDLSGDVSAIIEQPLIISDRGATKQEIEADMAKSGFEPTQSISGTEDGNDYFNPKTGVFVRDLHGQNVLYADGKLRYIDPIIELDTVDKGYGGTRSEFGITTPAIGKDITPTETIPPTGKTIEPNKEVKANQSIAIEDIRANEKYKDIKPMEAGMLLNSFKESEIHEVEDKSLKGKLFEKLLEKDYIEVSEDQPSVYGRVSGFNTTYKLTEKGKGFNESVKNRLETRKGVKAGTDLFPETANIPEYKNKWDMLDDKIGKKITELEDKMKKDKGTMYSSIIGITPEHFNQIHKTALQMARVLIKAGKSVDHILEQVSKFIESQVDKIRKDISKKENELNKNKDDEAKVKEIKADIDKGNNDIKKLETIIHHETDGLKTILASEEMKLLPEGVRYDDDATQRITQQIKAKIEGHESDKLSLDQIKTFALDYFKTALQDTKKISSEGAAKIIDRINGANNEIKLNKVINSITTVMRKENMRELYEDSSKSKSFFQSAKEKKKYASLYEDLNVLAKADINNMPPEFLVRYNEMSNQMERTVNAEQLSDLAAEARQFINARVSESGMKKREFNPEQRAEYHKVLLGKAESIHTPSDFLPNQKQSVGELKDLIKAFPDKFSDIQLQQVDEIFDQLREGWKSPVVEDIVAGVKATISAPEAARKVKEEGNFENKLKYYWEHPLDLLTKKSDYDKFRTMDAAYKSGFMEYLKDGMKSVFYNNSYGKNAVATNKYSADESRLTDPYKEAWWNLGNTDDERLKASVRVGMYSMTNEEYKGSITKVDDSMKSMMLSGETEKNHKGLFDAHKDAYDNFYKNEDGKIATKDEMWNKLSEAERDLYNKMRTDLDGELGMMNKYVTTDVRGNHFSPIPNYSPRNIMGIHGEEIANKDSDIISDLLDRNKMEAGKYMTMDTQSSHERSNPDNGYYNLDAVGNMIKHVRDVSYVYNKAPAIKEIMAFINHPEISSSLGDSRWKAFKKDMKESIILDKAKPQQSMARDIISGWQKNTRAGVLMAPIARQASEYVAQILVIGNGTGPEYLTASLQDVATHSDKLKEFAEITGMSAAQEWAKEIKWQDTKGIDNGMNSGVGAWWKKTDVARASKYMTDVSMKFNTAGWRNANKAGGFANLYKAMADAGIEKPDWGTIPDVKEWYGFLTPDQRNKVQDAVMTSNMNAAKQQSPTSPADEANKFRIQNGETAFDKLGNGMLWFLSHYTRGIMARQIDSTVDFGKNLIQGDFREAGKSAMNMGIGVAQSMAYKVLMVQIGGLMAKGAYSLTGNKDKEEKSKMIQRANEMFTQNGMEKESLSSLVDAYIGGYSIPLRYALGTMIEDINAYLTEHVGDHPLHYNKEKDAITYTNPMVHDYFEHNKSLSRTLGEMGGNMFLKNYRAIGFKVDNLEREIRGGDKVSDFKKANAWMNLTNSFLMVNPLAKEIDDILRQSTDKEVNEAKTKRMTQAEYESAKAKKQSDKERENRGTISPEKMKERQRIMKELGVSEPSE